MKKYFLLLLPLLLIVTGCSTKTVIQPCVTTGNLINTEYNIGDNVYVATDEGECREPRTRTEDIVYKEFGNPIDFSYSPAYCQQRATIIDVIYSTETKSFKYVMDAYDYNFFSYEVGKTPKELQEHFIENVIKDLQNNIEDNKSMQDFYIANF